MHLTLSVRCTAHCRIGWKGTFPTGLALIQIFLQGELRCKRIGADVVDIERFVLPACACADLASKMCVGETPFERGQEIIYLQYRATARSVRQRCSIPRSVCVLVRALGWGGQGRLLLAVTLCPAIREFQCALVGPGDVLQVTSTPHD